MAARRGAVAAKKKQPKGKPTKAAPPPERDMVLVTLNEKVREALERMYERRGLGVRQKGRSSVICEAILFYERYDARKWHQESRPPPPSSSTSAPSPTRKPGLPWRGY